MDPILEKEGKKSDSNFLPSFCSRAYNTGGGELLDIHLFKCKRDL